MFDPTSLKNSSLEGKVAIVTGSTQGLGEATAHLFADRGIEGLVVTGRNAERGAKVKLDLEARGVKTVFVQADLASMDERGRAVARAVAGFRDRMVERAEFAASHAEQDLLLERGRRVEAHIRSFEEAVHGALDQVDATVAAMAGSADRLGTVTRGMEREAEGAAGTSERTRSHVAGVAEA